MNARTSVGALLVLLASAGLVVAPAAARAVDLVAPEGAETVAGLRVVEAFPGMSTWAPLSVTNDDEPVTVTVQPMSLTNTDGRLAVAEREDVRDPSTWLSVPTDQQILALDTGASGTIDIAVNVPTAAAPGDYAAAVTLVDEQGEAVAEIGLLIRLPGLRTNSLEIEEATVSTRGGGFWPVTSPSQELSYRLVNTGNEIAVGALTGGASTLFSRFLPMSESRDIVLLPGSALDGAGEGAFAPTFLFEPSLQMSVVIDPDDELTYEYYVSGGTTVWDAPWLLIILVPVVIVLCGLALLVIQRRHHGTLHTVE